MGTEILVVWIPSLRRGVPSNASGMRGYLTPYRTRAQALRHEHWANQAPWASARRVEIMDGLSAGSPVAHELCSKIVLSVDFHGDDMLSEREREAARLIRAGQRVAGVRLLLD